MSREEFSYDDYCSENRVLPTEAGLEMWDAAWQACGEQIAARLRERANEIAGTFDDYALITAELRSLADEIGGK